MIAQHVEVALGGTVPVGLTASSHAMTSSTATLGASWVAQFAPRGSAARRCPPEQACQNAWETSSAVGLAAQGTSYFLLTTERVPVGCQVWFENTTGDVPIKVPPTRVNNATRFAVGLYVDLPPDYQCRIRMFLDRDGQELPADWTMKLTAYHVDAAMDPEANEPRPRVVVGAGPSPGVLLGSVTAKR